MTPLSEALSAALTNLSRKEAGEEVGFISISAARSLVDAGLAERTQEGWKITSAGRAALAGEPPPSAEVRSLQGDLRRR